MENTGGNHGAPFRPSAAASTHPYAYAGPNIHQPFSDAGLSRYFLHGGFYGGFGSNAERFADCFYYPAHDATGCSFAVHVEPPRPYGVSFVYDSAAGHAQDAGGVGFAHDGEPHHGFFLYGGGFAYDRELNHGATGDGLAIHGEPHAHVMECGHCGGFAYYAEAHHGFFPYGVGFAYDGELNDGATGDGLAIHGEPHAHAMECGHCGGFAYYPEAHHGFFPYDVGFAYDGEPHHGAAGDGLAIHGEPICGAAGHAHDTNCGDFACNGEPNHGSVGHADANIDGFAAYDWEAHHGAARHADATGDGFASDGEPHNGFFPYGGAGHMHDVIAAPRTTPTASGRSTSCTVQSVWSDNCAEVFEDVLAKLRQPRHRLYVALDLEFVADTTTDLNFRAICWNQWYHHLHAFVNGGDVFQVGLVFAFEHEHHHEGAYQAPSPVIALEINLKLNKDASKCNETSIDFLKEHGHSLADHRDRGVTTEQFINGLMRHLVSAGHDDSITWIMFHGDHDLGFLMRMLQGALPSDRATFMRQVRRQFPVFYDVRVLSQLAKEGFSCSFKVLAGLLEVQHVGDEHHAGSDALLTMSCFSEILRRSQHQLHRLESRECLLSGMEDLDMAIRCARHIGDVTVQTFHVREGNFDEHTRWIKDLVTSNFKIVGVEVSLPTSGRGNPLCAAAAAEQEDYDLMKSSLEGIGQFQVIIGFMNAEGMPALGHVWKFYLRCSSNVRVDLAGQNDCVDPRRLARLLESCGATHNPDVVWVTYQGLEGIACLIKSSLPAGHLPGDWSSYNDNRRARFPGMYDVGLIAQGWPDTGLLPTGCRGTLYDIARNLKVIKDDDRHPVEKVLLVLGCYKRLEESPHFSPIASVVQGQLMASRSCHR